MTTTTIGISGCDDHHVERLQQDAQRAAMDPGRADMAIANSGRPLWIALPDGTEATTYLYNGLTVLLLRNVRGHLMNAS